MDAHYWSCQIFSTNPGEHYDENQRAYWRFEIDDAELRGETQSDRTLNVFLQVRPGLCMQLDAWDADPASRLFLMANTVLYREHYDRSTDAWVMRLA
jgi:hypothetical protein